jgi:prefoldin subunit 5
MFRHATEYYYQNKIEKLEKKLEKLKAKLKELNLPEDVLREFTDDELF